MNVILLVIDALRLDHLSINGYERKTSPNIDKLVSEGTYFSNAYTVLPNTKPTFASILTGKYPYSHGVRMVFNNKLRPGISTMQAILKSHGYSTAYTKSDPHTDDGTENDFDFCDPATLKIRNKIMRMCYKILHPSAYMGMAEQQISNVIRWVKKNFNKKFFILMHTNDLHWPYLVPAPFQEMFDPRYKGKHDFITLGGGKITRGELLFGHKRLPEEEIKHAIAHYDGGLKYVDEQIGRLMRFLEKNNLEEDTLVILMADHGENLGEHGYYFQHGEHLYNTSLRVPLAFKNPKLIPKGRKIASLVQSLDIMPTMLDILNIPLIDDIDGVSLMPLIEGKADNVREFAFVESVENHFKENDRSFFDGVKGKWRAMISGKWKIIYIPHPENSIFELYDIENDPEEKNNLIDLETEAAEEMKRKILNYLKSQENWGIRDLESLEEKSKVLLRKLGYIN